MGLMVCFDHLTDRKLLINKMIESNYLGFEPIYYTIDNPLAFDTNSFLNDVAMSESYQGIILENDIVSFNITYPAKENAPLTLTWEFDKDKLDIVVIKNLFNINGFVCAYLYDYWDVFWQSETTISGYQIHERDYSKLKMTRDKWDREIIDVSKNYGRQTLLQDLWLIASPIAWLGKGYFKLVCSKSKLLTYPNSKELENDIVEIELFQKWQNIEGKEIDELRIEQEKFRNFIDALSIEKRLQ